MEKDKLKSQLYPYVISLVVVIYITTQFLTIGSTSNTGLMLKEVAQKQNTVFEFLIGQSIEASLRTSSIDNVLYIGENHKEVLLETIAFNKNIKVYDLTFFDLEGNLLNENYEGISSFSSVFGNINPSSIIEPTVINIRYSNIYNDTVMDILVPIYENGKLTAIMWQTESFQRINYAMKNVSILETGESYIIDENGVALTDLKKVSNNDNIVTIKESKLVDNTLGGFESEPYLDYNDEYVYGYHTNLNLNNWKLIVEVDESEIASTANGINSFLVRSMTLILAVSKLLEPMLNKRKKEKKQTEFKCIDEDIIKDYKEHKKAIDQSSKDNLTIRNIKKFIQQVKTLFKLIKRYIYCSKVFYKNRSTTINIVSMVIIISISVIGIYRVKTDSDIQNNLDLSSQVNRRIISYYVNEIKGQVYLSNRIITEFSEVNMHDRLDIEQSVHSNILNVILLDENNKEVYNTLNIDLNNEYAKQAISENHSMYNSIGVSDIFYDENYGQYVFYMSGKVLDHQSNTWKDTIYVVSGDNLISMLNNNEVHSSRMITILNEEEIMYSNSYTEDELSEENYTYLKSKIDTNDGFTNSVFNINKYENMQGVEVYGNYSNIDNKKVVVYGSYSAIDDTEWQLLYEEPVDIARQRVFKGAIDLLINVAYQYVEKMIEVIG